MKFSLILKLAIELLIFLYRINGCWYYFDHFQWVCL